LDRVGPALTWATARLGAVGIEGPRAEARLLLEHATGLTRERQLADPHALLSADAQASLARLVGQRATRMPLAYILGRREFHGHELEIRPGVLVPRPETETLVDAACRLLPDSAARLRVLDLGTGSGCLLLAVLALFPNAAGTGTDLSDQALAVAAANAARLGLADRTRLLRTSWGQGLEPAFDLILANPPYIATADLASLEPEVAEHEPRLALDGGVDGTDAYRALTPDLLRLLAPDGVALLEIGRGQEAALGAWFGQHGLQVRTWPDLAGIVRCLELHPAGNPPSGAGF
jgi:release factor glutamine methyltransferase